MASGLALIWHSRPLSVLNIEQRWSSAAMRGAEHCARRTWWQLVPIPNPHCHVCRPLLFLADIELRWSSAAGSRTLRPQNLVMPCCYPKFPLCRPLLCLLFLSVLILFCSSRLLNTCLHPSPPNLGGAMFDMVGVLGIPSSFLDCYLNIKPLLHRPAGLSLGIASHPQH